MRMLIGYSRACQALSVSCLLLACASSNGAPTNVGGAAASSAGSGTEPGAGGSDSSGGGSSSTGGTSLPQEVPPRSPPGSCGLDKPAFCEDFEKKAPGGRGGDLDESIWAFSRWGHETRQHFVRIPAKTEPDKLYPPFFCGKPLGSVAFGDDVAICDGVG